MTQTSSIKLQPTIIPPVYRRPKERLWHAHEVDGRLHFLPAAELHIPETKIFTPEQLRHIIFHYAVAIRIVAVHLNIGIKTDFNYIHFAGEVLGKDGEVLACIDGYPARDGIAYDNGNRTHVINAFARAPIAEQDREDHFRHYGKHTVTTIKMSDDPERRAKVADGIEFVIVRTNDANIPYEVPTEPVAEEAILILGRVAKDILHRMNGFEDTKLGTTIKTTRYLPYRSARKIVSYIGALEGQAEVIGLKLAGAITPFLNIFGPIFGQERFFNAGILKGANSNTVLEAIAEALHIRPEVDAALDKWLETQSRNSGNKFVAPGRDRKLYALLLRKDPVIWKHFKKNFKKIARPAQALTVGAAVGMAFVPEARGQAQQIFNAIHATIAGQFNGDTVRFMREYPEIIRQSAAQPNITSNAVMLGFAGLSLASLYTLTRQQLFQHFTRS